MRLIQDSQKDLINVRLEYGNTVSEEWTPGILPSGKVSSVSISGSDYSSVVSDSVPDVQTEDPSDLNYSQVGAVWVVRTYYATKCFLDGLRGRYEFGSSDTRLHLSSCWDST